MNLNSRLGMPDKSPDEPTGEEAVLLALVVSVMSVVTSEAAMELAEASQPAVGAQSASPTSQVLALLPSPCRHLIPEQVVKIQLGALKLNDSTNAGIHKVYEYLAPANYDAIGARENFVAMMTTPLYQPLLGFSEVELGRIATGPGYAEQQVSITPAAGSHRISYLFTLSLEVFGENAGCWLIDSITKA